MEGQDGPLSADSRDNGMPSTVWLIGSTCRQCPVTVKNRRYVDDKMPREFLSSSVLPNCLLSVEDRA